MDILELAHLRAFCLELARSYSFSKKELIKNANDLLDFILGKSVAA